MAFWTSISAGQWSGLAMHTAGNVANPLTVSSEAAFKAAFATAEYTVLPNLREFPDIGTPSNIVNVPQYGQSITSQVQGQADAVDATFTINYVPSVWANGTTLGDKVGDGVPYLFQLYIASAEPPNADASTTGLGTVPNAIWYFAAKLEDLLVSNNLTDAVTAQLSVSLPTGKYWGPYTQNAA